MQRLRPKDRQLNTTKEYISHGAAYGLSMDSWASATSRRFIQCRVCGSISESSINGRQTKLYAKPPWSPQRQGEPCCSNRRIRGIVLRKPVRMSKLQLDRAIGRLPLSTRIYPSIKPYLGTEQMIFLWRASSRCMKLTPSFISNQ
jgi:hypothetical protein